MEHTLVRPANGDEYVGHVPVGQLTGTGTFRCAKDGAVYTGEYEGNRFHGIGELTSADGNVYLGQFKGGNREGDGVYTWANGNVYRGQFKGDKREGDGVLTRANGRLTFGEWKEDTMEVSSVPFDAANPTHAAGLRAPNEAEARRVGAPHRRRA